MADYWDHLDKETGEVIEVTGPRNARANIFTLRLFNMVAYNRTTGEVVY